MDSLSLYLKLYWEFFKTGLFAVGGGMATLPFLSEISDKTGWFSHQQLADMVAIAESTPGPIGVNMATYVGYTVSGVLGGIIATLGLITPSLAIILIISRVLVKFKSSRFVKSLFYFLRPASVALIIAATLSLSKMAFITDSENINGIPLNISGIILAIILLIISNCSTKTKKLHPLIWIAASCLFGLFVF